MEARAVHRDRAARHASHYKIDCLAAAPAAVKAKSRRSLRAALGQELYREVHEVLAERYGLAG